MARNTRPGTSAAYVTISIIEEHPNGDRARYSIPVLPGREQATIDRAARIIVRLEGETGHKVRAEKFTHKLRPAA